MSALGAPGEAGGDAPAAREGGEESAEAVAVAPGQGEAAGGAAAGEVAPWAFREKVCLSVGFGGCFCVLCLFVLGCRRLLDGPSSAPTFPTGATTFLANLEVP